MQETLETISMLHWLKSTSLDPLESSVVTRPWRTRKCLLYSVPDWIVFSLNFTIKFQSPSYYEMRYLRRKDYCNELYCYITGIVLRGGVLYTGKRKAVWRYREHRYLYIKICSGKPIRTICKWIPLVATAKWKWITPCYASLEEQCTGQSIANKVCSFWFKTLSAFCCWYVVCLPACLPVFLEFVHVHLFACK